MHVSNIHNETGKTDHAVDTEDPHCYPGSTNENIVTSNGLNGGESNSGFVDDAKCFKLHTLGTNTAKTDGDFSSASTGKVKATTLHVDSGRFSNDPRLLSNDNISDGHVSSEFAKDGDCSSVCVEEESNTTKTSSVEVIEQEEIKKNCASKLEFTRDTSCYDNAPDGGWGWVVTFAAFMASVIIDGISFSFGIFYRELLVHFQESKSLTSWIVSVLNGTFLGIGLVAGMLVTVFGCRPVAIFGAVLAAIAFFLCTFSPNVQVIIVVYGLLGGVGLGLLYLPSLVTVGHYFKKRRALATGIAVCGSGLGGFVFPPLGEYLIEEFSWKGAMWIISAIVLNGIPIGILLRPLEGSDSQINRKKKKKNRDAEANVNKDKSQPKCCDVSTIFDFELLKSPTLITYGLSCFLCMLGFYIPFTFIPDLADSLGMSQGAMLISIIGILNIVARVLVGWCGDRSWADPVLINSVALVIGGGTTIFVPFYSKFELMAVYCAVFGISIAVFESYCQVIMAELLGIEKLTSSFGLVTMCKGLSAFIGAPLAGALSDQAGDYNGAFYLAGIAIAFSGVICFPLRVISRWEKRRAQSTPAPPAENGVSYSFNHEFTIASENGKC